MTKARRFAWLKDSLRQLMSFCQIPLIHERVGKPGSAS